VGNAVISAIRELTGIESYIDGINDLYVNGKKICGILLESGSEFDSNTLQWIVAGIGINFDSDISSFPEDVKNRASSLFETGKATISKNVLIAKIIENISDCQP
jgi:BirA family biotin operon repressor/biotin-[acetyl-CoA-carboxylase] ligase